MSFGNKKYKGGGGGGGWGVSSCKHSESSHQTRQVLNFVK